MSGDEFTAHLIRGDLRLTVCGQPWERWQAPRDRNGDVMPYGIIGGKPTRENEEPEKGDIARQCPACLHEAIVRSEPHPDTEVTL